MSEKVTINFGGYDDSSDDTINFEAPTKVLGSVENVSDLDTFIINSATAVEMIKNKQPFLVYVQNVNDEKGSLLYRGSYYLYDYTYNKFQEVAMGNHSHANIDILNSLGDIQSDDLADGEKKTLILQKTSVKSSTNSSDLKYKYTVSLGNTDYLPDVPSETVSKPLYLTTDSNGTLSWTNSFAPAQTFKILQYKISDETISLSGSNKCILLTTKYLSDNSASYNNSQGDEILVFDNGELVPCLTTTNSDNSILITIASANNAHTFDSGETVTLIIIKSGVQGVVDSMNAQFATKADLLNLASNNKIDLSSYVTKDDLINYAATRKHVHSDYIRKDQYDIFDYRYADYHHTHSQYLTRSDVLAIISDVVNPDLSTSDNETKIIQSLVNSLKTTVTDLQNSAVTQDQMTTFFNTTIKDFMDSDSIAVTINGDTLTNYLTSMNATIASASSKQANAIYLSEQKVNIGTGNTLGGFSDGDVISGGSSLTSFISTLVTQEVKPQLVLPTIKPSFTQSYTGAYSSSDISVTFNYLQNNGGNISLIKVNIYTDKEMTLLESSDMLGNFEAYTFTKDLIPQDSTGFCFIIHFIINYDAGTAVVSNTGNSYVLPAGSLTYDIPIYAERKIYVGHTDTPYDITSDNIAEHLTEFDSIDDSLLNGYVLHYDNTVNCKAIIIMIPDNKNITIADLIYLEQNCSIMDMFSKATNIAVGESTNDFSNLYTCYYLVLNKINTGIMDIKILSK